MFAWPCYYCLERGDCYWDRAGTDSKWLCRMRRAEVGTIWKITDGVGNARLKYPYDQDLPGADALQACRGVCRVADLFFARNELFQSPNRGCCGTPRCLGRTSAEIGCRNMDSVMAAIRQDLYCVYKLRSSLAGHGGRGDCLPR